MSHRSSIFFQVSQRFLFPKTSIVLFILREFKIVRPLHVKVAPLHAIQVCVCVCVCVCERGGNGGTAALINKDIRCR